MSERKHGWVGCVCGKLAACEDSDNGALRCGPDCCFGDALRLGVDDLGRIQEQLQAHYNEELERTKRELQTCQQAARLVGDQLEHQTERLLQVQLARNTEHEAHERTKGNLAALQRDRDALAARVRELEGRLALPADAQAEADAISAMIDGGDYAGARLTLDKCAWRANGEWTRLDTMLAFLTLGGEG
jgi:hypothetical protein